MLGNVLKEINTAPDAETRKKALIKLTERGKTFASEEEFNKIAAIFMERLGEEYDFVEE